MTDLAELNTEGRAADPSRFISITRARLIARYRMHTIPGKPEELETNLTIEPLRGKLVVSLAYSGGELRIRKHGGERNRDWIEVRDFRLRDGWLSEVYDFLDDWMGYVSPANIPTRPIRDNPQA
jgi:hypothetical protein